MAFEENIRKWITLDNQIKKFTTHVKSLREQKTHLSDTIIAYAVDQNLSHNTVEITDGALKFQNIKVTAPLNFKFMTKCLNECIADEEQVKLLITYIKQKREVKYVPEIKRTYTK